MPSDTNRSAAIATPFESPDALLKAHGALLKQFQSNGNVPVTPTVVVQFINRAQSTGALLYDAPDRQVAQSLLDYWTTQLYDSSGSLRDAMLAEFDPLTAPELDASLCPYIGLDAFQPDQGELFFGRERLVDELIDRVQISRLLLVLGPSGSGKSSLVLGGLRPRLQRGAVEGSQRWRFYRRMVPGSDPLAALANLLRPASKDRGPWTARLTAWMRQDKTCVAQVVNALHATPAVLIIDQFEELFTLCGSLDDRKAFLANLTELSSAAGPRHTVILTMRSDFESSLALLDEFQELVKDNQVRVTPPTRADLRDAIEKPAALRGLLFDEGVVDDLVDDIVGDVAALPLLQFTLLQLWDKRDRNRVTRRAYDEIGGGARRAGVRSRVPVPAYEQRGAGCRAAAAAPDGAPHRARAKHRQPTDRHRRRAGDDEQACPTRCAASIRSGA